MLHIIWYIIVGFVIGLIARAIMPGVQHLGLIMTTLLGIGGSIVGGLIGRLFSKPAPGSTFHPAGFIMSIIGAIILLFIWGKLAPG
ncbi:MAG: GlsB/YeaQ/YmgE family stress response membrane protein [Verrucomicrobia bacterium]|nr:MAG: GlsB/YeaQ/YmgE family stress response membrane protein [Verrucomicrobiota bacterium]PYJ93772.1 MAG: GlsB/YeaQ/YmgE family stress response membrane protein [Verrucomicrobiota bacterium]PYK34273.1 MAG: GlsB/YeaQ/YmgE family stress response membrane protein [Verrucomicrobiota bacterium]PYL18398.1 MAG: GlsB/YeaQ/YmgE family stress response membrane protein [Verrucomicrobiota bacterium]PYL80472.1 MAG: GlsB/YeaQ/YmgE family stress response membrane protein [Verrucomicrobiota bacterium]